MTEELKQAAQAALEQLEFLNACYPHKTATDASDALRRALTQRPAAQDEREADEVFLPRRLAATQKLTQLGYRYDSAHGKWLPAPQQATPEPVGEAFGYFRALPFGWEQCGEHDDGAVALYDRPAPGVPDAEDLRDRLVAISAAVADSDDRAAQSMLGETLRLLAAAQAKGDDK